ncbi:hypothetical protein CBOM_02543 [Ceraceosorus bombacis]|uniref:Uncharacterized protein n=1 Tax=Ceraceosorus bombacis TaxID=401625 RepID=A0A0P1BG76_9BASI|nr:hypothetical protein CBOM_02543 [Ceraceosorus bombacis]
MPSSAPSAPKSPKVSPAYTNPTRHTTGGPARSKPSESELEARLAKARAANENIMARRAQVEEDLQRYGERTKEEEAKRREAMQKEAQAAIAQERAANAARKLQHSSTRAWDAEKEDQVHKPWERNVRPDAVQGGARARGARPERGA